MDKNRQSEIMVYEWNKEKALSLKKTKKQKKLYKILTAVLAVLFLLSLLYITILFGTFKTLTELRDTYIETAMTTGEHQWLATAFFPKPIIDSVTSSQEGNVVDTSSTDIAVSHETDILGQKELKVGDKDYAGNEILTNDIEQGIMISKVTGKDYVGKIVLIDDPSRVFVGKTKYAGSRGEFITEYLKDYDAIVGINASGFIDTDGHGTGGDIASKCLSRGKAFGTFAPRTITLGFTNEDKLIVGNLTEKDWSTYGLRDCSQFSPALIVDGKAIVTGSAGWGIQPRTVIGQREDGVVFFLIIDGRQPGYSIGATVGECAKILLSYGAVNAAACDGGSSSVLAYDSELINIPSTPMKTTGRYLPNAWLVASK